MEAKVRWAGMTLQMIQKPLRTHCKNRSRNELRITGEEKPHRHGEVQSQLQSLRLHAIPGSQEVVSTFHVDAPPEMPCLAGGGGGIFFFWQLGEPHATAFADILFGLVTALPPELGLQMSLEHVQAPQSRATGTCI